MYKNPIAGKRNALLFIVLTISLLLINSTESLAQLCTGSLGDPVVDITFGAGTSVHSNTLPVGTTSYTYSNADFPTDGSYTIENTTAGAGNVWWSTTDHTGNTGGYMMVVNASVSKTDYFYKTTVNGLCPGTTYEFAAWVVNLLRSSDISPPNITFTISTTAGVPLGSYTTGTIPLTPSGPTWKQYGLYFKTPDGVTDVVVQMTNNSNGGAPANDLALDDITFRPCGPQMISSFSSTSSVITQSTCAGGTQTYTLTSSVSPGYVSPVYQWEVSSDNGVTWSNLTTPGATTITTTIPQPTAAGTYLYRLVSSEAANAGSVACQVASTQLNLTVTAAPIAAFTFVNSGCLSDAVVFTDASTTSGSTISSWLWDFGDGQTSALQNPSHSYTTAGTYTVKLTTTGSGCQSYITHTVTLNAKPVAAFTYSSPACAGVGVTLTDKSTPTGTLAKWAWDYGDGTTETLTTNTPFTHTYTTAGTYKVTLQVTSASGCTSDITPQNIVVNPLPVVDFSLPDVCLSDAFAQFTDLSTISDNTQSDFTYLWNFGDASATVANLNTSTDKNPKHKYSQAGNYTVSLTVTSKYGCVGAVKTKAFTVNGAVPVAGFTVENVNNLCSSDDVIFDNNTSVDFGNITKIVMYYDFDSNPDVYSTYTLDDNTITAKFNHNYGSFSTPLTKTYHVRMEAYSGGTCFAIADKNIVVNANPSVVVSAIGPLCQEDAPVQIATNTQGFTGTGVFSGTGISSSGLFNPATAGPGTFTISYLFTANTGCSYATSQQVIVYPTPVISAPATLTVLEGGQLTINATTTSTGLTYKWTPATGLSDPTSLTPIANPSDDTQYTLTATSANGCVAVAQTFVSVLKAPVVPNTFTPNGDGINDTWNIKYLNSYPNATVEIFTRYGEKIYSTIGYPVPWDGTYKGAALPVGVYYYVINPKNGRSVMSGSLTIIR
ncbi:PKD domain-containing protein [Mucilaginibacter jinjuensis]|uniref:PKD domain-containing protein n=1 Tax=Mucilaginibacter jinjuensis TaxID=1176721 RepID=A0ABY7T9Z1_9SPHI|nr:PKD domain-containing protein [Mucilaginibacter jinjuensis]WCT12563.1 PKD domain-containing protein [Mucilaginibacter jinjuensis]